MQRRSSSPRVPHGSRLVLAILFCTVVAACNASSGPTTSGQPATGAATDDLTDSAAPSSSATPSVWHGTITFHAVIDQSKDDSSTSGQGTFQETTVSHAVTKTDVTDTFTVGGHDPDDITFGIGSVTLSGTVANQGTTLERAVFDTDKHNALGCHFTDEVGTETSGSWSGAATAPGEIRFADDGTYTITIAAGGDAVTGEAPASPLLPKRLWETTTIIAGAARDCPGPGTEQNATDGPIVQWASSMLGGSDSIQGTLDLSNPGSVLDGSATFHPTLPDGTVTVTWHLVHDGAIVLPHS